MTAIVSGGKETLSDCPKCGRRKLYTNLDRGLFYCHRCEYKGSKKSSSDKPVVSDTPELDKIQADLSTLLRGGELPEAEPPKGAGLPEGFKPFWDGGWSVPAPLRSFMQSRGLTRDDLLSWGLGTSAEGSCRGRLILPVVTRGEVSYQARALGAAQPKYLNPAGTKGSFIYGYDRVASREGAVIICEGAFDVIAVWRAGGCAVGLMGKSLSKVQADLLSSLGRDLIVCLDGDAQREAAQLAAALSCPYIRLKTSDDPDSFLQDRSIAELLLNRQ